MRNAATIAVLLWAVPATALDVTPEFLADLNRLRQAVEWNDRQVFAIILEQKLQTQLQEIHDVLGVRSRLQADQIQLDHVYGGLLAAWFLLPLDSALNGDSTAWQDVRLLNGALQPWLKRVQPKLAADLKRAVKLAQLADDNQTRHSLFTPVLPHLKGMVKAVFDPIAAKNVTAEVLYGNPVSAGPEPRTP